MTKPRTITVSYSEIKDARRCSFKHDLQWRHYYRKKHREECDCALCFGSAWHAVMEAYYDGIMNRYAFSADPATGQRGKRGGWHAAREETSKNVPEHLRERILWMLEGYAAHYGREPDWRPLATEHQLIVPLPQLYEDLRVLLKVKIDLIIQDKSSSLIWVDDHKTCAQLPTDKKMVDPQLPLYVYALRENGGAFKTVFGARYSYALKPGKTLKFRKEKELKDRFRRRLVPHTDNEITAVARDCYKTIYMRYMEADLFDVAPRNNTPDCTYCDFAEPCKASRKGYNLKTFLNDYNIHPYKDGPPKDPE